MLRRMFTLLLPFMTTVRYSPARGRRRATGSSATSRAPNKKAHTRLLGTPFFLARARPAPSYRVIGNVAGAEQTAAFPPPSSLSANPAQESRAPPPPTGPPPTGPPKAGPRTRPRRPPGLRPKPGAGTAPPPTEPPPAPQRRRPPSDRSSDRNRSTPSPSRPNRRPPKPPPRQRPDPAAADSQGRPPRTRRAARPQIAQTHPAP
jgi:hypothetical protein